MFARSIILAFLLLLASPALAIDPGTASGSFVVDGATVAVTHAIALRQDDAEGLLLDGPEMRVVVSDVEIPPEALHGIAFLPVETMAREGRVRGLLFRFDPANRDAVRVTLLARPASSGESLATITITDTAGLWRRLLVGDTRITGAIDRDSSTAKLALDFSAPVFNDKVVADVTGPAARSHELYALMAARTQALGRGDIAAMKQMSSRRSRATLDALPPEYLVAARTEAPAVLAGYRKIARIVVRSDTAVALMPDHSWVSFAREDGGWKVE